MEKSYLRYRRFASQGVITSPRCNIGVHEGLIVTGAVRDVIFWNPRVGEVRRLHGEVERSGFEASSNDGARGEVVCVAAATFIAAAYASGLVRVWRRDEEDRVDLEGRPVVSLRWDPTACFLVAGEASGDVCVWDVVAEKLHLKLRGHTKPVCDTAFLGSKLVTACSETLRLWDRDHCERSEAFVARTIDVREYIFAGGDELVCFDSSFEQVRKLRRSRPSEPVTQLRYEKVLGVLQMSAFDVFREKKKKRKRQVDFELLYTLTPEDKPRSFVFFNDAVVFSTRNNTLEVHGKEISKLELPGHRSAVRSLALGDEGQVAAATTSGVKVWGETLVRAISVKKALCVCYSGKRLIVGTKDGRLLQYDVASGASREAKDAHAGSVWSVDAKDKQIISAGDTTVKVWRKMRNERTIELKEDVLYARFVGEYVAVATMDACVRVLFADTFKFKVTLYGHKLSVLALDATSDCLMLATGAADKTLKFWGLEFGDLRRSTLAHDDAITAVEAIKDTHYVLTASKDGNVKMWDADRDEPFVQTFKRGHIAEVWALKVSDDGSLVVSAGADRSLVRWRRTDEPVFAAEEAQVQVERKLLMDDDNTRQQHGRVTTTDRLAEALELAASEDAKKLEDPAGYKPSMLLLNHPTTPAYVLATLAALPSADLEPAILVLPLDLVASLLGYLASALGSRDNDAFEHAGFDLELCARVANFAVKLHHRAVIAHTPLRDTLDTLRHLLRTKLNAERELLGRNLAAIRMADLLAASSAGDP